MIKNADIALNHWSIENIDLCATRQKEILEYAYSMLKRVVLWYIQLVHML